MSVKLLEEVRPSSALTRTQLVSMVASLRGELHNLVHLRNAKKVTYVPTADGEDRQLVDDSYADAHMALELTAFRPAPEDLVPSTDGLCDGTYDDSWM